MIFVKIFVIILSDEVKGYRTMRTLTVINPQAGKGQAGKGREGYIAAEYGDCLKYIEKECKVDPDTHFDVYGGDGTLNQAVNGIMRAEAGKKASVTVLPFGSGTDTVKTFPTPPGKTIPRDQITYAGKYCINMINIGFDCNVVATTMHYKKRKGISGEMAYILGVIHEFFRPFGEHFKVHANCADGSFFDYEGDCMLCAACNGQWCGGSFHNSPLSDMSDGVFELLIVKKVSRLKFIRLIGQYKNGTLIDKETGDVVEKWKDLIFYKRVTDFDIFGCKKICADGEIENATEGHFAIAPSALLYKIGE